MRNLTKTLAVVSLLIPASAYPLGIGEIKLHSALNQNLDAEIALVLSPGEKASDIKVNLAPPDKFDESGVLWTYFLSKIKFQAIPSPNGSVIIKVTSNEALKEPFLDFLLEVSWPKGNLYREFTVLVDPPDVYEQAAVPVSTQIENYEPEQNVVSEQRTVTRPRARRATSAAVISGTDQYGPIARNDTLWNVAERVSRPADISIEQMMIALYETNPGAFYKQNINALLAGKTLKVPSREVIILKFSRQQALAEFNRQTQAWKNRSVQAVAEAETQQGSVENQLTLVAPKQETVAENAAVAPDNGQVVAEKQAPSAAPDKAEAQEQATSETKESKNVGEKSVANVAPADEAIRAKVAALEKQLAVMQELIALKDQQLAVLQEQSQKKPATEQQTVPAESGEAATSKPIVQEKPVLAPTKTVTKPIVHPPVIAKPEAAGDMTYWYYLGGGSAGLGLLAYLGWLWWRKRQVENGFDTESRLAFSGTNKNTAGGGIFSGAILEDSDNYETDLAGDDNIFTSDFATGDFDMFDMDQGEIDPISEADVYLAYGRYQQAEELMRHAIKEQPQRDECKLKLLEIFYASENRPAFEQYANELANVGKKGDNSFWAKVTEMGSEICPDSGLFDTQVIKPDLRKSEDSEITSISPVENNASKVDQSTVDMDFELASFDDLFSDGTSQELLTEKGALLDFDNEPQSNNESIDFDLSAFSMDAEKFIEGHKDLKKPAADDQDDFESFDFDVESNNLFSKENGESGHSFNKAADFRASVANTSLDDDFDFNTSIKGADTLFSGKDSSFGMSDLTEMDAMETKLDLAIAYIDMGDKDAAKEIALEVAEKGTTEQKMVAQSLLNGL